jgi:hypothetical protein
MPDRSKPRKRQEGLVDVDLGDEVILYDERTHDAHALNASAAAVWRELDGRATPTEIGATVWKDLSPDQRRRLTIVALHDLATRDLLDGPRARQKTRAISRRTLLKGLAAAGAIAPVIATMKPTQAFGPGTVSAITCTNPGCSEETNKCAGTICCACIHTTENTNVCVTPLCNLQLTCSSSAQCPPGYVCMTSGCCTTATFPQAGGGGGGAINICVPLCASPSAPCPFETPGTQRKSSSWSWLAR